MFNYSKISKLTVNTLLSTLLITTTIIKPSPANSDAQKNQKICKDNNGHGNNETTELTEVKLVDIYLSDGTTYVLNYVVGTIDPSNPSPSALNLLDIRVDYTPVSYRDLAEFQIQDLLSKIKNVEDIELNGNSSTSENCNSTEEPNDNPNNSDDSSEVVLYSD